MLRAFITSSAVVVLFAASPAYAQPAAPNLTTLDPAKQMQGAWPEKHADEFGFKIVGDELFITHHSPKRPELKKLEKVAVLQITEKKLVDTLLVVKGIGAPCWNANGDGEVYSLTGAHCAFTYSIDVSPGSTYERISGFGFVTASRRTTTQ